MLAQELLMCKPYHCSSESHRERRTKAATGSELPTSHGTDPRADYVNTQESQEFHEGCTEVFPVAYRTLTVFALLDNMGTLVLRQFRKESGSVKMAIARRGVKSIPDGGDDSCSSIRRQDRPLRGAVQGTMESFKMVGPSGDARLRARSGFKK
jgi:hypothetical protein